MALYASHCKALGQECGGIGRLGKDYALSLKRNVESIRREKPKELFEYIARYMLRTSLSPADFAAIGKLAGDAGLLRCTSFSVLADVLRQWFPVQPC